MIPVPPYMLTCSDRAAIKRSARTLGAKPTKVSLANLSDQRVKCLKQVEDFNSEAALLLQLDTSDLVDTFTITNPWEDSLLDEEEGEDCNDPFEEVTEDGDSLAQNPEDLPLFMPSNIQHLAARGGNIPNYSVQESELRLGQMNDALAQLRIALANKSLKLRKDVRHAKSQAIKTRAWAGVDQEVVRSRKALASYHRARQATASLLGSASPVLLKYKSISKDDLTMKGDITEEARLGQSRHTLAWFWRLDGTSSREMQDSAWITECVCFFFAGFYFDLHDEYSLSRKLAQSKGPARSIRGSHQNHRCPHEMYHSHIPVQAEIVGRASPQAWRGNFYSLCPCTSKGVGGLFFEGCK